MATAAFRRLPGARAIVAIWLGCAAALIALAWPDIARLHAGDSDDYMRLLEVRDLLAGQHWFDLHQYRMNPPFGASMHWSRLVDLPIAAALLVARGFLAEPLASAAAMTVVPLLELLVAMLVMRRLLLALGESEAVARIGAAILLLFPMLLSNFLPLRIDHHAWQAIAALACLAASRRPGWRGAALTGLLAAIWLSISLEGELLVVALAGLMALRYLLRRENALAPFLLGCGAALLALFLATRGPALLLHPTCDTAGLPHIAAFAGCGALALGLPRLRWQAHPIARGLALAIIGGIGVALIALPLGACAIDPYHGMDGLIRAVWFANIPEGLPITRQDPQTVAMLVWSLALLLAGFAMVRRHAARPERWTEPFLFALAAVLLSFTMLRGAVAAQLLAVPFSAVLLANLWPKARAIAPAPLRIVATLAVLLLLTPTFASAAGKLAEGAAARSDAPARGTPPATGGACDYGTLARLPVARLFAPLDPGPEILVRTAHSVVAGDYHRNFPKIHEVLAAFTGDPRGAEAIVRANHARYLVFCASSGESRILAAQRPDSLAAALLARHAPDWLTPQPGFAGALRVFAVAPH